ncbi:unnamed protein product [Kuraishia capsulata CBS 1993]|uniref:Uncharacterized protein n=1 Tax=Kuraishia capsulata CBS 1993 TaxID=1382522 RepID=W6MQ77_9ASCO|nr:uncharacterized protein KUCA_T00003395001 [Kuraishia capsulata CBS 1993]CDK27417.1 unnamed protein product [Kuraishia capsulata CBS 1993]
MRGTTKTAASGLYRTQRMFLSTMETSVGRKVNEFLLFHNTPKKLKSLVYRAKNATNLLAQNLITSEGEPIVPRSPVQPISENDIIQWIRESEDYDDLLKVKSKLPLFPTTGTTSRLTPNATNEFLFRSVELQRLPHGLATFYSLSGFKGKVGPRSLHAIYLLEYIKLLKTGNPSCYERLESKLQGPLKHTGEQVISHKNGLFHTAIATCKLRYLANDEYKDQELLKEVLKEVENVKAPHSVKDVLESGDLKAIEHTLKANQVLHGVFTALVESIEAAPLAANIPAATIEEIKAYLADVKLLAEKSGEQLLIERLKENAQFKKIEADAEAEIPEEASETDTAESK